MRIAMIIADERDGHHEYGRALPYFGSDVSARLEGFEEINEPEVHIVSCVRDARLKPAQLANNIYYHPVLVKTGYWRGLGLQHVIRVRRKLHDIMPDAVHGYGTEYYMALCAAFSGYINCISILGNMRSVARKTHYRPFPVMAMAAMLEQMVLSKTDAVFCNSQYTYNHVGKLCRRKWIVCPPVRKSFFEIRRSPDNIPLLLCIGHVVPHKNQLSLIEALDELAEKQRISLCFIGRLGTNRGYAQKFVSALNGRAWCKHLGEMTTGQVQQLLTKAAILVHPTKEDSFANAVAEAMAAGVPVAVSRLAGIADVIVSGENGLVFDPDDSQSIYSAVRQLLHGAMSARIGQKGRVTANKMFSPRAVAERHMECYQVLLRDA